MARFTVSDCMDKITNRFDMTLVAALRARQITKSGQTLIKNLGKNNKAPILALREIADDLVDNSILTTIE